MASLFMLSYTVSRKEKISTDENKRSKDWADNIRDQILNIQNGWKKYSDVETTFTGALELDGFYVKAGAAKTIISNEILPFLKEVPLEYKPVVSLVLLVNGLNEVIEFKL